MLKRLKKHLIVCCLTLMFALPAISSAFAFAIWQGTAVIEAATGSQCAANDLDVGKTLRVIFKPRTVGGNSTGSELLFVYEYGSFQMRKSNGDLAGSGTYDGTATFFSLHNAGNFVFAFNRGITGQPFDLTITPSVFDETTVNLRITGTIGMFFGLFTVSTSNCDVTVRINLLKKP